MGGAILPTEEDIALNPALAAQLDEARAELAPPQDNTSASHEFYGEQAAVPPPSAKRMKSVDAAQAVDEPESKLTEKQAPRQAVREQGISVQRAEVIDAPLAKPASKKAADEDIPAEYRGKSLAQLAREHKELHRKIGLNGAQLGPLRAQVRQLEALSQQAQPKAEPEPAEDEISLLVNPEAAITRALERHPVLKTVREAAQSTLERKAVAQFTSAHPDAQEILSDPDFRAWAAKSPVRMQLLQRAHTKFDVDAANHVFEAYKAVRRGKTKK